MLIRVKVELGENLHWSSEQAVPVVRCPLTTKKPYLTNYCSPAAYTLQALSQLSVQTLIS